MLPTLRNRSGLSRNQGASVNRLSPLFDELFEGMFARASATGWEVAPMLVREEEDHFYIEMDAPGVHESDIDVSFHDGHLVLQGERKSEHKEGSYDTRRYGRFEQRITLPSTVDADRIEARLTNGVLHITLPKSEQAKPRKIAIQAG